MAQTISDCVIINKIIITGYVSQYDSLFIIHRKNIFKTNQNNSNRHQQYCQPLIHLKRIIGFNYY